MNKIKVYLQYPWKFPDSPYYKYLIQNPPKNIEYLNVENQKGVITNANKFFLAHKVKIAIRKWVNILKISMMNAKITKSRKPYDIIHCAHCISKNKNKPWVADFEGDWQFYIGKKNPHLKRRVRKILLSKNCKKILPWTEKLMQRILKEFPEIKDKIEVVYPALPLPMVKKKKHQGINLLFVARYFYHKGGLHTLEAMDKLTKKHKNVNAIFVSEVPEHLLEKYSKNPKIKFYNLMPQDKLFKEIYSITDIFIYPGYSDSLGFAILEAMSFGIPVVTVNVPSRDELIEDGKTGLVIDLGRNLKKLERREYLEEVISKISDRTEKLIKSKKLRDKISKNCMKTIKNGKFSIKERNKKLERIYKEALNN